MTIITRSNQRLVRAFQIHVKGEIKFLCYLCYFIALSRSLPLLLRYLCHLFTSVTTVTLLPCFSVTLLPQLLCCRVSLLPRIWPRISKCDANVSLIPKGGCDVWPQILSQSALTWTSPNELRKKRHSKPVTTQFKTSLVERGCLETLFSTTIAEKR